MIMNNNSANENNDEKEKYTQEELIDFLKEGHKKGHHCFVLIYLVGCGPCNMTKPEWKKVAKEFDYHNHDKGMVIVDIDQNNLDKIHSVIGKYSVSGFPTMLHIHNNKISSYEDSKVKNKNRSADSFREWISEYVGVNNTNNNTKLKNNSMNNRSKISEESLFSSFKFKPLSSSNSSRKSNKKHKQHKQRGGKWSLKYKRSINCKHPKGFSQKQHCKYGRKHGRVTRVRSRNIRNTRNTRNTRK